MRNASGIKIIANSSIPENTIMIRGEIKQEDKLNIEEMYPKKPKFEELHTRDTFWVKNEIFKKLHSMTKGNKGMKTNIINDALEQFLNKIN